MKKDIFKNKKIKAKDLPIAGIIDEPQTSKNFKTGNWRLQKPKIDEKKCINCLTCWVNCPDNAIKVKNGKRKEVNLDYCKGCGICAEVCPVKAIVMEKENK